ncbi:MAG: hypothetical protein R2825_03300 [Saprospiraceae bacterium]|jgi:hypothetical protein
MQSFEQELKAFFKINDIGFQDNSKSFKRLDFSIQLDNNWKFHFDAKEKRQSYNISNWHLTREQEPHTFILDDLAARKILAYGPYSGMLVRDNILGGYYFFSVVDLFLIPKSRVNRPIFKEKKSIKGKWIIDLRHGIKCENIKQAIVLFKKYIDKREDLFMNILECYGDYEGEEIGVRGEIRKAEYWDIDVKETR